MNKFRVVKRGYDISEVENYFSSHERVDKDALSDKSIRIEELKADIVSLSGELSACKKREENVNLALITAIEKANEIECQAKLRFALECERIKLFRGKWESYSTKMKDELGLKDREKEFSSGLTKLEAELANMMRRVGVERTVVDTASPAETQYLEESKRLLDKVRERANAKQSTVKFNLDDINNPPALADICKDLGLCD